MITLFTAPTPNGRKITIMLEELGIEYTLFPLSLFKLEQKSEWYLKINPNGKIPAIIDSDQDGFRVIESGAILVYLAEKYNKFLPKKDLQRSEVFQWLFFQMANVGPIVGQLYAFQHLMPEKSELTIKRFTLETIRIIKVLDDRLANRNYLCDEYSIADIATYPWVVTLGIVDISIDEFPHLKAWVEHIGKRPAVQKGMTLPEVDLSFEERLKIVKALGGDFVTGA